MRDLAQVAGHIHDGRDVEVLKDRTAAPRMARHKQSLLVNLELTFLSGATWLPPLFA